MTYNAFKTVEEFEKAVAEYTGAPYCVAVSSCCAAILTCLAWQDYNKEWAVTVEIPKETYIGVAQAVLNSGYDLKFRDHHWKGMYRLAPFNIWDCARRFTSDMYHSQPAYKNNFMCTSHHWSKTLGIGHGGCILHNNEKFDKWARMFRYDGRDATDPNAQPIRGHHLYLLPELAASGLVRLMHLPKDNPDLPNSNYPDLSKMEIFGGKNGQK